MEQSEKVEGIQFKWGKKRGNGGEENKDVQFYESFTYEGSEYSLYDCVLIATTPDTQDFYVGKIIKIWEHNGSRKVDLLWFFKPSEISRYTQGVQVLANELFLASGSGAGLTNENLLEAIAGKCNVLCISKDIRNPQPSDEEIKSAKFLFRRTFDVDCSKISEKIDDQIAGVDVKFIFNRTSSEKKASDVQKVATNIHGTEDSLKPNLPSTSGSVRPNGRSSASDLSGRGKSDDGYKKEEDNERLRELARKKKSTLAEERSNKDSGWRGSRRNDCCHEKKDQENEIRNRLNKLKSRLAEGSCSKDSYSLDGMIQKKRMLDGSVAVSDRRRKESQRISHDGRNVIRPIRKDVSKDSYCLDDMPQPKRKLNGSVAVSDGRKYRNPIRTPRDKVTRGEVYSQKPSFIEKKQELQIPRFSKGKETKPATENGLSKKLTSDCKISKRTEGKMLTEADYRRGYRVSEVIKKPNVEEKKWYRALPWEENLRCAERQGTVVLLQNLDPTYTSDEVEDLLYSALNEQCTARMLERTSATIPHIGEALVIFKRKDAAETVIRKLDEGCLLLPNGRVLVATSAKVNPPAMPPPRFNGHMNPRTQIRRGMGNAVATSHCAQTNTVEFDLAMEWCVHRETYELTLKRIYERQIEEKGKVQIDFNPNPA